MDGVHWDATSDARRRIIPESYGVHEHDQALWKDSKLLSAASIKFFYYEHSLDVSWWSWIWFKGNKVRFAVYSWMAILEGLKTRDVLQSRGVNCCNLCVLCSDYSESHNHLFVSCDCSSLKAIIFCFPQPYFNYLSIALCSLLALPENFSFFAVACWSITCGSSGIGGLFVMNLCLTLCWLLQLGKMLRFLILILYDLMLSNTPFWILHVPGEWAGGGILLAGSVGTSTGYGVLGDRCPLPFMLHARYFSISVFSPWSRMAPRCLQSHWASICWIARVCAGYAVVLWVMVLSS